MQQKTENPNEYRKLTFKPNKIKKADVKLSNLNVMYRNLPCSHQN